MIATSKRKAAAKIKIQKENEEENGVDGSQIHPPKTEEEGPSSGDDDLAEKATKLTHGTSKGLRKPSDATLAVNRRRLSTLLKKLSRAHNWKEASGVLSVLLKGTPRGSSFAEDRRNFLVAMEIHKRLGDTNNYSTKFKKMYEIWMSKLAWMKKLPKKRHSVQLELALFYLSQGDVQEAHNVMKFLVQDRDSASEPTINLLHGLILYQIWYSGLPKEMRVNGFDIRTPSGTYDMTFDDGFEEPEMLESSNDHNAAVNVEDVNYSSRCASESSVGNAKNVFMECKKEIPTEQSSGIHPAHVFYLSGSEGNEGRPTSPKIHSHFEHGSIFLAHGLDTSLLPIQLKHMAEDLERSIYSYRRLANEQYEDAVKHLRLALYSTPPLLASLLPLIQLLLLGDRVGEALDELEKSCNIFNVALPFRLRARLLESFHSNHVTIISSCYEDVLKRDPTCNFSLERLIKMHKSGNYSTTQLLEMIVLHLDADDGKSSIWGELASCFLKLLTAMISDQEDCISANGQRDPASIKPFSKIPTAFTESQERSIWKVRCRWWLTRHFSKNAYLSEMQAGDWELLASKAACATHLYGPENDYVKAVLSSLQEGGDNDQVAFLQAHLQNPTRLRGFLNQAASQREGFHQAILQTE